MSIDHKVASIIFGLKQVHASRSINDQVINLGYLALDNESEVVQNNMVFGIFEIVIKIVSRFTFALYAFFEAHQFIAQLPFLY